MKVLLFNGSSRKNGCTYMALSEVADILNHESIETDILQMAVVRCVNASAATNVLKTAAVFSATI